MVAVSCVKAPTILGGRIPRLIVDPLCHATRKSIVFLRGKSAVTWESWNLELRTIENKTQQSYWNDFDKLPVP